MDVDPSAGGSDADISMEIPEDSNTEDAQATGDDDDESSPPIPHRQRPRSSSRGHHQGHHRATADPSTTGQRGRTIEKPSSILPPTTMSMTTRGGTARKRSRLRMTENQIIAKLSAIVSGGHPSEKYKTLDRIGHGYVYI